MKRRRAFTLLEVVAALVLMGSVLAGSLLAFSKHRKQLALAEKRLTAVKVADDLIHSLNRLDDGIPIHGKGRIAGHPNWMWQTRWVGETRIANVPLHVVRFQVVEVASQNRRSTTAELVSVEIVTGVTTP